MSACQEGTPTAEPTSSSCFTEREVIVRGTSMLGIFNNGDTLTLKDGYYNCHPVQKGDIIVFEYNEKHDFIKQVFAQSGDTLTVKDDFLLVNNHKIQNIKGEFYQVNEVGKSYIHLAKQLGQMDSNNEISRGYFLVLGTAKVGGYDSRRIGLVSMSNIIGKIAQ